MDRNITFRFEKSNVPIRKGNVPIHIFGSEHYLFGSEHYHFLDSNDFLDRNITLDGSEHYFLWIQEVMFRSMILLHQNFSKMLLWKNV